MQQIIESGPIWVEIYEPVKIVDDRYVYIVNIIVGDMSVEPSGQFLLWCNEKENVTIKCSVIYVQWVFCDLIG